MVALKDLFSGRVQVTLKSISYEMTDFAEEEATLTCQDSVKHIETGNDYLAALITRKLKFSPKGPFKLMVSYTTKFYLKQEYVGKAAWDEYNLKELSQEDKEFLTASLISVAPTSSAPRKMYGKPETLFTWLG